MAYDTSLFEVTLCEENPEEYLTNPYFSYTYKESNKDGGPIKETSASFSRCTL